MAHLNRNLLEAVHRGEVSAQDLASWLLHHLVETCPRCRRELAAFEAEHEGGSEDAAARALKAWVSEQEEAWRRADEIAREDADELLALADPGARLARIRRSKDPRLRSPALVHRLMDRVDSTLLDSPRRGLEVAELAHAVALRVSEDSLGRQTARELMVEARVHVANAQRACGDLAAAEVSFEHVFRLLGSVSDPELQARVFFYAASLRKDQRRFDEAERLLGRAEGLYRDLGADRERGRVLLNRATLRSLAGDPEEAISVVGEARKLLAGAGASRDHLFACHNLASYLVDAGRPEEAQAVVEETLSLFSAHAGLSAARLRLTWLQGRLAEAFGRQDEALAAYRRVRDEFLDRGLGLDAALVGLDLAALHLRRGERDRVRAVTAGMVELFRAHDLSREVLSALLLLARAAAEEALTLEELKRAARFLACTRETRSPAWEEAS